MGPRSETPSGNRAINNQKSIQFGHGFGPAAK